MIVFHESCVVDLRDYGIQIPAMADRKLMTFCSLQKDEFLSSREEQWRTSWQPFVIERQDLLRAHTDSFVDELLSAVPDRLVEEAFELFDSAGRPNRYEPQNAKKPLSKLRDELLLLCSGTIVACEEALKKGFSYHLGGGLHHAHKDAGAGFCVANDIVVALRSLQARKLIRTAWVVDVDAHKGDGTAALTQGDDSILTLSIHMARGWPLDAPHHLPDGRLNPVHTPSDVDIGVEVGQEDLYLPLLKQGLESLQRKSSVKPDLILVVNGSDPSDLDVLPSASLLKLSMEQMLARDMFVYDWFNKMNVPQAYVMAGGYGPEVWRVHSQFIKTVLKRLLMGKSS